MAGWADVYGCMSLALHFCELLFVSHSACAIAAHKLLGHALSSVLKGRAGRLRDGDKHIDKNHGGISTSSGTASDSGSIFTLGNLFNFQYIEYANENGFIQEPRDLRK